MLNSLKEINQQERVDPRDRMRAADECDGRRIDGKTLAALRRMRVAFLFVYRVIVGAIL